MKIKKAKIVLVSLGILIFLPGCIGLQPKSEQTKAQFHTYATATPADADKLLFADVDNSNTIHTVLANDLPIGTTTQTEIDTKEDTLTNEAGLYSALSDVTNFMQPGTIETITANWVNTDNPWADNEVADDITITNISQITTKPITSLSATNWRLFYSADGGVPVELELGAADTYLKSTGAAAAPIFDTPSGSGDILSVGDCTSGAALDGTSDGGTEISFYDGTIITRATGVSARWQYMQLQNFWGNISGGDGTNEKIYIDDIYIQIDDRSHVEIGDNATWANCTHREIQIPTAWGTTEITVTLNQGSLNTIGGKYLFVIDSDGAASDGYLLPGAQVTIGGTKTITIGGTKTVTFH